MNLSSVLDGKPIVLWFWFPHDPTSQRFAPSVEELARDHADEFTVVGVGTLDSFKAAQDFMANADITSFQMLWGDREPWEYYGLGATNKTVVLRADGKVLGTGFGPDLDEIRGIIG